MIKPTLSRFCLYLCCTLMVQGVFFARLNSQTVIGGDTIDQSAVLDIQDTARGVLLPRLTTVQRSAIVKPATGLLILNTTRKCLETNIGSPDVPDWKCVTIGVPQISDADTLSWNNKIGLSPSGNNPGNMLYWNGTSWVRLSPGLPGQGLILSQEGLPVWSGPAFPFVTTIAPASIAPTSAAVGGNIGSDGGADVSARGIVWGTSINPTLSASVLPLGNATGVFSGTLSGLSPNTLYYVRAYATNSAGTAYGNQETFTTLSPELPLVSTKEAISLNQSSLITGGNIISDGGSPILEKGVVWSTMSNPTVNGNKTDDGSGSSNFMSKITGLSVGTTYFLRAYAKNSLGINYGNELTFEFNPSLINMNVVPAGTFEMGCTIGDSDCYEREFPVRSVTLSDFLIGETEITQSQFQNVVGINPSNFSMCTDCPVEKVSWYDALVFCNRLSIIEGLTPCYYSDLEYTQEYGKNGDSWFLPNGGPVFWNYSANGYRLSTEAKWEYAARGGNSSLIYSGSNSIDDVAWYNENSSGTTKPVKSKLSKWAL